MSEKRASDGTRVITTRLAATVALGVLSCLLALQAGFTFTLEFVREYQDSPYWQIGAALLFFSIMLALVPALSVISRHDGRRSARVVLLLAGMITVPALLGAVAAAIAG